MTRIEHSVPANGQNMSEAHPKYIIKSYGMLIMSCWYRASLFDRDHKNSSGSPLNRWNPQHLVRLFRFVPEETLEWSSRWIFVVHQLCSFFASVLGFPVTRKIAKLLLKMNSVLVPSKIARFSWRRSFFISIVIHSFFAHNQYNDSTKFISKLQLLEHMREHMLENIGVHCDFSHCGYANPNPAKML